MSSSAGPSGSGSTGAESPGIGHSSTASADDASSQTGWSRVERIHHANFRGVLAITGGGSLAISDLLTVPGASQTILEAHIPYSSSSLAQYLGSPPEQACSHRTARALAMAAFLRALALHDGDEESPPVWGVGGTASLRSSQPKRGDHRFHLALQTPTRTLSWSLTLTKSARTRPEEERLTANFLLALVAEGCHVLDQPIPEILPEEQLATSDFASPPGCHDLLLGRIAVVRSRGPDSVQTPPREERTSLLLFPGAFNPPHPGHTRMAELAEQKLGRPIQFEISLENVDKPLLDYQELSERLTPFQRQGLLTPEGRAIWLTRAPTFVEKSRIFPAATFVVGIDTAIRIADPRYYSDPAARDAALATLREQGCHFLVFGRVVGERFQALDHASLPNELRAICSAIPAEEFRDDHSSSAIRRQWQS